MKTSASIGCFGSSLLSSYWGGADTYFRGIFKELARMGYSITCFEPISCQKQFPGDAGDGDDIHSVVYEPTREALERITSDLNSFDIIIKCSGASASDEFLEALLPKTVSGNQLLVFWDVNTPVTLNHIKRDVQNAMRQFIRRCDLVLTHGGGGQTIEDYKAAGAKACVPVYNAADPAARSREILSGSSKPCDLLFIGDRLPHREASVSEFFGEAACLLSRRRFIIGGNGWSALDFPPNVVHLENVWAYEQSTLNESALAVLQVSGSFIHRSGHYPATRMFNAAAEGACLITDGRDGIASFFEPDEEILVARNGLDVAMILSDLTLERAARIGESARKRVLKDHCYANRALEVDHLFKTAFGASSGNRSNLFGSKGTGPGI